MFLSEKNLIFHKKIYVIAIIHRRYVYGVMFNINAKNGYRISDIFRDILWDCSASHSVMYKKILI
jgi:hypothetical protein